MSTYLSIIPKPVERKGGVSESWLPTPGDIKTPTTLQKPTQKKGFFGNLWGGIKETVSTGANQIKNDPLGFLQSISGTMNQQDVNRIQGNITSIDPNKRLEAERELIEYQQYLRGSQSGLKLNTTTIIIGVVILMILILIFRRK